MKLNDFLAAMERIAPKELALDFDNPGLLVEPDHDEIQRILVALDCTAAVANEAIEMQADLVLTHHPLFFHPVQRMRYSDPDTKAACILLRNGTGMFAAHTNLDAALGGVNDTLCELFEIDGAEPIDEGVGRVGMLRKPMPMTAFLKEVETKLKASVRFAGNLNASVRRVAVLGGSGASAIREAAEQKADVLLTGEAKHSDAIDARTLGLNLAVAGHYETERVVLEPLIRRLQNECFDVQYKLSRVDASPFARLEEGTP
jgi:dinuclear metal center YbgI/SA1388 family protein